MKAKRLENSAPRRGVLKGLLVVAAPAVCCGAVILPVLIGSAGLTAVAGFVKDPLVQGVAVLFLLILLAAFLRRRSISKGRNKVAEKTS
ncbi:MAG: hypothetical protein O6934_12405 [SAR324 cluster bacterium]|nr:hypothetical protein [SAR324 cluster bacterium]